MRNQRQPARVIGRYVLHGEIAAGGMATVQLGRLLGPVGFSRTVAVKRLHAEFARDPEFVSMFLDEARLAARIRHPNVVSTLDVVAEEGELFLVLEFVLGESLAKLVSSSVKAGKTVPPRIAVGIVTALLYGLAAAHDATSERGEPLRIVHRDVSPQNVLVGVDGVARVLDFGIAKAVGRMHQTREGVLKGKVAYMPPEQLKSGAIDHRVDVYAASVVLWETLTGVALFAGENEWQIANGIMEGVREPPSSVVEGIPKELDEAVLRGLSRSPAERFATAMDMATALERALPPATTREIGAWVTEMGGAGLRSRQRLVAEIESAPDSAGAIESLETLSPSTDEGAAPSSRTRQVDTLDDAPTQSLGGREFPAFPAASGDATSTRTTALLSGGAPPRARVDEPTVTRATARPSAASRVRAPADAAPPSRRGMVYGAVGLGAAAFLVLYVVLRPTAPSASPTRVAPSASTTPPRDDTSTARDVSVPAPLPVPVASVAPPPAESAEPEPRMMPDQPGAKRVPRMQPPPPSHKASCTPPYSIDSRGIKHLKAECLLHRSPSFGRHESRTRHRMRRHVVLSLASLVVLSPALVRADTKEACLSAYVDGQELRKAGKLRRASERFLQCSQTTCPELARADCSRWLGEVTATLSTVVLDVRDAGGRRVTRARVTVDGDVLATELDGAPLPMDPGAHTLRVEASGAPPVEEVVVLKTGEKDHVVRLTLSEGAAGATSDGAPGALARPVPVATYALAAVGVVSLASFVFFAESGRSGENDLQACKPFCAQSDVDATRTKYLVANVSLGVSAVALGAAAYYYFTRPSVQPTTAGLSFDLDVGRGDAAFTVRLTR